MGGGRIKGSSRLILLVWNVIRRGHDNRYPKKLIKALKIAERVTYLEWTDASGCSNPLPDE